MTTDANQETEQELDIDFIESYFGKGGVGLQEDEKPETEVPKSADEEGDKSSEGSTETPTTAEIKTYTEEELEAAVQSRFADLSNKAKTELARREQAVRQQEINDLIRNGDPEEAVKFIREQLAETELRDKIGEEEVTKYITMVLPSIITPEFVASLTDEEEALLAPDKFSSDAEYYQAAIALREAKAKSGLFGEDEVKRRVAAELEARENERRGQRVRQPSGTSTPRTEVGDGLEGLSGRAAKDAQWAAIAKGWEDGGDE